MAWTLGLLLLAPWWALVVPFRSIWRKERIADDAPPTPMERFRQRHPTRGREIRLRRSARSAILGLAVVGAIVVWLTKDDVDRYLWAVPMVIAGSTIALARWNDL